MIGRVEESSGGCLRVIEIGVESSGGHLRVIGRVEESSGGVYI